MGAVSGSAQGVVAFLHELKSTMRLADRNRYKREANLKEQSEEKVVMRRKGENRELKKFLESGATLHNKFIN
ncbi:MAG: hypothetical protein CSA35_00185 [Dethiosulfovibrio peptidovorans]|nr:MAG: hypothetical protein CSA35_00185 [Dethiosulfovibrio peptidovorans]